MVATARQNYAGRSLRIGDEFHAESEADAADLEALRFASRAEVADTSEQEKIKPKQPRYKRRDLRAQK